MKIEFDHWATSCVDSAFFIEMECLPRVGEEVEIHKSLFPAHYSQDLFRDAFENNYDESVCVAVARVVHQVGEDGRHMPLVCFDI